MTAHRATFSLVLAGLVSAWGGCDEGNTCTLLAGTGTPGHKDGNPGTARFAAPSGLVLCSSEPCPGGADPDLLIVADRDTHRIRGIQLAEGDNGGLDFAYNGGNVATLAGSGQPGLADGHADQARFRSPEDVALHTGTLFIADTGNHVLRVLNGHNVSTLAGTGQAGFLDGSVATAQFNEPAAVAVDAAGVIYVADRANHCIRRIADGQVSTLAGTGQPGMHDGPAASAQFTSPGGVAVDRDGTVYVADSGNHLIRAISNGHVQTVAGGGASGNNDGVGVESRFNRPFAIAVFDTTLAVADHGNATVRVIEGTSVSTDDTGDLRNPGGVAMTSHKSDLVIFVADQTGNRVYAVQPHHPNW